MKQRSKRNASGEKRREAILAAAWDLFNRRGFAAVSIDDIVRIAGGSKATVYEIFGSKEGLFRELVTSVTREVVREMAPPPGLEMSPREALTRIGESIGGEILTEKGIGLYRLAVTSVADFPEMSRLFYESGPERGWNALAAYLKQQVAAGRLRIANPRRAAEFFFAMIAMPFHISMPTGCSAPPTKARIRETVKEAVDVFMAAYGAEGARADPPGK